MAFNYSEYNDLQQKVKLVETNILSSLDIAFLSFRIDNTWKYLKELEDDLYSEKSNSISDIIFQVTVDFLFSRFLFKPLGEFMKGIPKYLVSGDKQTNSLKKVISKYEDELVQSLSSVSLRALTMQLSGKKVRLSRSQYKKLKYIREAKKSIEIIKYMDGSSPDHLEPLKDFAGQFYGEITNELKDQISKQLFPTDSRTSLVNEIGDVEKEVKQYKKALGGKIGIFFNGIIQQAKVKKDIFWIMLYNAIFDYALSDLATLRETFKKYFKEQFRLYIHHVFFINKTIFQCCVNYRNGNWSGKQYPALSLAGMKLFSFISEKELHNFTKYVLLNIGGVLKYKLKNYSDQFQKHLRQNGYGHLTISCEVTEIRIPHRKVVKGVLTESKTDGEIKIYLTLVGRYVIYDHKSKCKNPKSYNPPALVYHESNSNPNGISQAIEGAVYYGLYKIGEVTNYHPTNYKKNTISYYPDILEVAKKRAGLPLKKLDLKIIPKNLPVRIGGRNDLNFII